MVGAFFDYDWTNLKSSISIFESASELGDNSANVSFEIEDQWALGLRFGYLPTPSTLLYLAGGYTQATIGDIFFSASINNSSEEISESISGSLAGDQELSGYFIGGGVETKLTSNITLKLEYRYADFGSEDVTLMPNISDAPPGSVDTELDTTIQTGRFSANYRF